MYRPSKVPSVKTDDGRTIASYLEDELLAIANAVMGDLELTVQHKAPIRPVEGLVVYADGTVWNPGSGEGVYSYGSDGLWHAYQTKDRGWVTPWDYAGGVDIGNGINDATAAVRLAVATGRAVYFPKPSVGYLISSDITCVTPGQKFFGDGIGVPTLLIKSNAGFTNALFAAGGFEPGIWLTSMRITFVQPDPTLGTVAAMRAQLIQYVPLAIVSPRPVFSDLSVFGAWNGIDATGNAGGMYISNLWMSAFNKGINIDSSTDTIRINDFHFWPFGLTANQSTVFFGSPTTAIYCGRVDGCLIDRFLNISWLGLHMVHTAAGEPWVQLTNSGFDTFNAIIQESGRLQVDNCYSTIIGGVAGLFVYRMDGTANAKFTNFYVANGSVDQPAFTMRNCTGGTLCIDSLDCNVLIPGVPLISIESTAASYTSLQFSNSKISTAAIINTSIVSCAQPNTGFNNIHIENIIDDTIFNGGYSVARYAFGSNNRVHMTGCRVNDKGAGAGVFITLAADDYHWISGNMYPGWTFVPPAAVFGYYSNNPH